MLGFLRGRHAAGSVDGQPPEGWAPDQRLTREETLASFTLGAAYAAHAETQTGSLDHRASSPTS